MTKNKMLQFTSLSQQTPPKRDTGKRKEDFKEIYNEFISDKAKTNLADVPNVEFLFVKYTVH